MEKHSVLIQKTAIYQFNPDIFIEDMFLFAAVKDHHAVLMPAEQPRSSTSDDGLHDISILTAIVPYPKATPKPVQHKTRQQKSSVITNAANELKCVLHLAESLSEREEEVNLESDELELSDEELLADGGMIEQNSSNNISAMVQAGTFAVAKVYWTSKNFKNFIAKIIDGPDEDNDYEVKFLKRLLKVKDGFMFPEVEELALVSQDDIVCVLPVPQPIAKTTRL